MAEIMWYSYCVAIEGGDISHSWRWLARGVWVWGTGDGWGKLQGDGGGECGVG